MTTRPRSQKLAQQVDPSTQLEPEAQQELDTHVQAARRTQSVTDTSGQEEHIVSSRGVHWMLADGRVESRAERAGRGV